MQDDILKFIAFRLREKADNAYAPAELGHVRQTIAQAKKEAFEDIAEILEEALRRHQFTKAEDTLVHQPCAYVGTIKDAESGLLNADEDGYVRCPQCTARLVTPERSP